MTFEYIPPPLDSIQDVERELSKLGVILSSTIPLVVPQAPTRPERTIEGAMYIIPPDNAWEPMQDAGLYIVLHNAYRKILDYNVSNGGTP